jgi:competence protein ComEA
LIGGQAFWDNSLETDIRSISMRQLWAWFSSNLRVLIVVCFALSAIMFMLAWGGSSTPPQAGGEPQLLEPLDELTNADLSSTPSSTETPRLPSTVIVYISGAVRAPDVYELPLDARIKDLVLAAGGLTDDADPEQINLAERLKDSEHVHVLRQGEESDSLAIAAESVDTTPSGPLDLNTANASDLDSLPGIGQSFADRIIEYRATNGPFASVEDLQKVKGIGAALFAKIAPLVSVGP